MGIERTENMLGTSPENVTNSLSLKYTIDDMGIEEFKRQVELRFGRALSKPRKHRPFTKNIDDFSGWVKGDDGMYSQTLFIENGNYMVKDIIKML